VLIPITLLLIFIATSACSSPPVAEFYTTNNSGNAPFDVSFVLGDRADGDSYRWDFGDGNGSTELEPTHTYNFSGEFLVNLTAIRGDRVSFAEATVKVEPGMAGWVVLEADRLVVSSFETVDFTATAYDEIGNPIDDADFIWGVDETAGFIDSNGRFTAGTQLGRFDSAVQVEFERHGKSASSSIPVEIVEGALHAVKVAPTRIDVQAGRSVSIDVQAMDEVGHVLDDAVVKYTALRPGDQIDSTGLFEPSPVTSNEGVDLISIEVELNGNMVESTISGTVHPGILDQIHILELPSKLNIGESHQLSAFATDRFDNVLELEKIEWSVSNAAVGSVTENGLFTAGTLAGNHDENGINARGFLNGIQSISSAPVNIVAGPATSIRIVPNSDSVPIAAGSPFDVLASDIHGNIIDIAPEEYLYEYSSAGRGNEVAVFIAGYEIGDFENAITVTLPSGVAGNDIKLVAKADISVRQRSSNIIAVEIVDQDGGGILFFDLETAEFGSADISFQDNGIVEMSPSWWPDGSRLVYVSDPTGELQVYTLDIETRKIVQLTDLDGGASMPHISPDGKSIVFVGLKGESWQLYIADIPEDVDSNPITMANARKITTENEAQHILPYWSPDGSKILTSVNYGSGLVRVVLVDPSGNSEPEIMGPYGSVGFGWADDGKSIHVGLSKDDGALDLGTLELGSSNPVFIDSNLSFLVAAWSPDDSELIAVDALLGYGWIVDSDGTGLRRVISPDRMPTRMSWRPKGYGDPVSVAKIDGEFRMLEVGDSARAPVGALDTTLSYSAVISTDAGDIKVELFDDDAPITVENFINLSRIGFYDGLEFHRVIPGFASQTGDNIGDGTGTPGYKFNDEFSRKLSHNRPGVLSMANAGSNSNGSQFFITHDNVTRLDAYDENGVAKNCADDSVDCHSIFGQVIAGLDVVINMAERDPGTVTEPGVIIQGISIIASGP